MLRSRRLPKATSRRCGGPDGEPLPFSSNAEIERFLEQAKILSDENIPEGVNRPTKLLLQDGDVQAHAVFRNVDKRKDRYRTNDGRFLPTFVDSYRFEVAAYRLSEMLEMGVVPPAVMRAWERHDGSVQLWVEGAMTEGSRHEKDLQPPDPVRWSRQNMMMKFFDALIQNIDRNQGNILILKDSWDVWLIDHTRSFVNSAEIPQLENIKRCERRVWRRFKEADPAAGPVSSWMVSW